MEKVWVIEKVSEFSGSVDSEVKVFRHKEDAIKQKEKWKEEDSQFIDDIQEDININENCGSTIEDEELYFYAYDGFNFESVLFNITEMEVL